MEDGLREMENLHPLTKAESWFSFWKEALHSASEFSCSSCVREGGLSYSQDPGPSPRTVWGPASMNLSELVPDVHLLQLTHASQRTVSSLQANRMGGEKHPTVHGLFDFSLSPKLQKSKILYFGSTSERQVGG